MVKKIMVVDTILWRDGGTAIVNIPSGLGVNKLILSGTLALDCGGNVVANCEIDNLKIRINNQVMVDINQAELSAGVEGWGILLWKEFYAQKHLVSMPTNQWIIELPTPLPKTAKIELIVKWASEAQAGCTDSVMDYLVDVLIEYDDAYVGKSVIPYITWDVFNYSTLTGHRYHYVPPLPKPLRAIIFVTEDNGTAQTTDVDEITIKDPYTTFFEGSEAEFEAQQEARSKLALSTAYQIYQFQGGYVVKPNTLIVDFYIGSACTDGEVHMLYICY